MAQIRSLMQIAYRWATAIYLWAAMLGTCAGALAQDTDPIGPIIQGRWEVISLTGSIRTEPQDMNPPWCEKGVVTHHAVVDKEETFIKFSELYSDYGIPPNDRVRNLADSLGFHKKNRLAITGTTKNYSFVFQFSFDNGFHTNSLSEHTEYMYESLFEGLWSYAFGLIAVSTDDLGTDRNINMKGESITGTKWGGIGIFKVYGSVLSENRVSGTWTFEEITAGPFPEMECRSRSKGSGTWVAVKK